MDLYSPFLNRIYSAIEMKESAETPQHSEHTLLEILDSLSIGAWVIDFQSRKAIFSTQLIDRLQMQGLTEKEQLEKTFETIHAEDRARVVKFIQDGFESGFPPNGIEYRLNLANDECIWVYSTGRMTYDEQGKPLKYYASSFDITQRKNYEKQLNDSKRIIINFFNNISHEFRTPLSIMLLYLDMMELHLQQAECRFRDKIDGNVSVLRQNTYRLLRLTSNLLDITMMDGGHMGVYMENGDIVCKAREISEAVANFASKQGFHIEFSSDIDEREMSFDSEKLERILLNLLSNAMKHSPPGGTVTLSVENAPDSVTLRVCDNGPGIPAEKREGLFTLFSQVNSTLARNNEGVGVGLALAKGLADLVHAKIWFVSEPGKGSTFFVRLPLLPESNFSRHMERNTIPMNRRIEMEFSDIAYNY